MHDGTYLALLYVQTGNPVEPVVITEEQAKQKLGVALPANVAPLISQIHEQSAGLDDPIADGGLMWTYHRLLL